MVSRIPLRLLKLEDGYHLLIRIRVNDKPAHVLIDTGASKTVFDRERSKRFLDEKSFEKHDQLSTGLGTSSMATELAIIQTISIGKVMVRNYKAAVVDLSHVNAAYSKLNKKPIDGVLGSDILREKSAIIDFGKKVLVLKK